LKVSSAFDIPCSILESPLEHANLSQSAGFVASVASLIITAQNRTTSKLNKIRNVREFHSELTEFQKDNLSLPDVQPKHFTHDFLLDSE